MRGRSLVWILISVACFLGAFYFWRLGQKWQAQKASPPEAAAPAGEAKPAAQPTGSEQSVVQPANTSPMALAGLSQTNAVQGTNSARERWLKYRLSNTTQSVGELVRSDYAISLANALIDSRRPVNLPIPDSLKAKGDPGSYVVQSRGPVNDRFREGLKNAGATIVSYIPQNAYWVRASASAAQQLAASPETQIVLPFEPYYKLQSTLLALAVEERPLPADNALNVVIFADARDAGVEALIRAGAEILGEERSPFGPVFRIRAASDSLSRLAGLPEVQTIGLATPRRSANDLSRERIAVATNSIAPDNYLGLNGANVIVQVPDTGVDSQHPDLAGRVFSEVAASLADLDGHGTHVAGIIASSGGQSLTVSNASGSILPPVDKQFRGMAPAALIYAQPLNYSDLRLQENAVRTNAQIQNNAWTYGNSDYDIAAANFDAGARDPLSGRTGAEGLVIVFAAGNAGNGFDSGTGVSDGTILSPATAKNVITVGAIEQPRNITNETQVVDVDGVTNIATPWFGMTDSDSEVASFSSRGNVGVQIEGEFGRFKPDVVAPGTFVVSTTEKDHWDQTNYYSPVYFHSTTFTERVESNSVHSHAVFLPFNTIEFRVDAQALNPVVDLPVYVKKTALPTAADAPSGTNQVILPYPSPVDDFWFFGVGNPTNRSVRYTVTARWATTNDAGNLFQVLSNMNSGLGPYYRYESGTSMAAADVSGMLALIEDFFTNRLQMVPSPALLKSMLINGSRTVNVMYDLKVRKTLNDQGWGLVNLTNSLPPAVATNAKPQVLDQWDKGPTPMLVYDQSPTNALATGDSHTIFVTVGPNSFDQPLRATLVWTDPPGNPAAGVKLVNDLDLVVTNLDEPDPNKQLVYFGNDFPAGSSFTFSWDTNSLPNRDVINNVENVFLQNPVGTNYSITVIGRRVNVNAVTAHTNNVAQDYALVVSAGDGATADALTVSSNPGLVSTPALNITGVTNEFAAIETPPGEGIAGQLLLGQHVGADSPLIGTNQVDLGTNTVWGGAVTNGLITLGVTNQWHFYIVTNSTAFTNAAFATFLPPTLSLPRMGVTNYSDPDQSTRPEGDIDLYVSLDPAMTNLDAGAVGAAGKSLTRGGTEVIAYSNSFQGAVYYVGVHSEDRQAAEYAFFAVFSEQPFSQTDSNGVETVRGINVPAVIPDGTPGAPGGAQVIGIALQPITMRRVVVTNTLSHQNLGDLFGSINHSRISVVLNDHSCVKDAGGFCFTNFTYIYEDNGENDVLGSIHTDGPGSLVDYVGEEGQGLWLLTEVDNANGATGRVERLSIRLEPELLGGATVLDLQPNSFGFLAVDVPPEATNMTICVVNESATPLPVQLYVRRGELPTLAVFDYTKTINPPGDCLTITKDDLPPLSPGRYYIGVYNPNPIVQRVRVTVTFGLDLNGVPTLNFTSGGPTPILDDAVTYSSITVTNDQRIVRAEVGVAIQHPRVSDLALTLISPTGKRILLYENRGGPDTANLGSGATVTNYFGTQTAGGAIADTNVIGPVPTTGTLIIDYDFFTVPDTMDVYYDNADIFSIGPTNGAGTFSIPYGPGVSNTIAIVMNQSGNTNLSTEWIYTPRVVSQDASYFLFSENTNVAHLPVKFTAFGNVGLGGTNSTLDDFESTAAGDYTSGMTMGTWTVTSNQASIVNDPLTAYAGNRFLALADGTLSNTLSVVPGSRYSLTYTYRGPGIVSWWRGENNGLDNVDGNNGGNFTIGTYGAGEVGQAFNFSGVQPDCVHGPYATNLITPTYTVEGWIKPLAQVSDPIGQDSIFVHGFGECQLCVRAGTTGLKVVLNFNYGPIATVEVVSTSEIPIGQFSHLAGTWDGTTLRLYINGVLDAQFAPGQTPRDGGCDFYIGGIYHPNSDSCQYVGQFFQGLVDELSFYQRVLSPSEINAIYMHAGLGKFDPAAPSPQNLAKARVNLGGIRTDTFYGANTNWQTRSFSFTPTTSPLSLTVSGLEPGMLLDSFVVVQRPEEDFVLPEQSLQALVGDSAKGTWTLEIWDNRAGAEIDAQLVNWQLRFILENTTPSITPLFDRIPVTNTISCGIKYYYVDVPSWVSSVTNRILFASNTPVNVWFNQTNPPVGTNPPDFEILANATSGSQFVLDTTNSVPPLVPGSRYYLGVQNLDCTTNVTFGIEVDFGVQFIILTNMIPYNATNSGASNSFDYYIYTVSSNAARAQFEINFPTDRMTLSLRKGLPPPNLTSFDYISANAGSNDELIVVITNSTPVPLTPGDWYLTAINISGQPLSYSIMASEWPTTGRPFSVTNLVMTTNQFQLTWETLNGAHYFIQGIPNLNGTNWYAASYTLTPITNSFTYPIPLPSPFQFFRVVEGLSLLDVPQPPPTLGVSVATNGIQFNWFDSVTARYQMQWTPSIGPPITWNSFTNLATCPPPFSGFFLFLDDGTQTGGLTNGPRFYRLQQIIVP